MALLYYVRPASPRLPITSHFRPQNTLEWT